MDTNVDSKQFTSTAIVKPERKKKPSEFWGAIYICSKKKKLGPRW